MKDIYKKALRLAVPMMIQNGITNAVGLVDNIMVGSLGTETMTAVSIVGQLMFVFSLAVFGGLSGPGIYGAQFFGQGNTEEFRNTFRMKHWIAGVCLVVGLLAFIFGGDILIGLYLKSESSTIDKALTVSQAKIYLEVMLWNMAPFVITQVYAGSLRETGDSFRPMAAGIISVAVDVILNYCLIYGHFGMPEMGVKGAAVATVAARIVEMLVVLLWTGLSKKRPEFLKGAYSRILIPRTLCMKMLKKGLPIFFNEFLWAAGMAALTQSYSVRGLEIIAGMNISNALCNMLNVVFITMGNAVGIIIGQLLGASQYEKAKKDAFSLMKFTGLICAGLTVVLVALSGVFPDLYDTTDDVKHYATFFIMITAFFFPLQGYLNALYFTLRSGGRTVITFLFDSVYSWVIVLPVAVILCYRTALPVLAVFAIVQSLDFIKVTIGYVLIRKGVWITNLAEEAGE